MRQRVRRGSSLVSVRTSGSVGRIVGPAAVGIGAAQVRALQVRVSSNRVPQICVMQVSVSETAPGQYEAS